MVCAALPPWFPMPKPTPPSWGRSPNTSTSSIHCWGPLFCNRVDLCTCPIPQPAMDAWPSMAPPTSDTWWPTSLTPNVAVCWQALLHMHHLPPHFNTHKPTTAHHNNSMHPCHWCHLPILAAVCTDTLLGFWLGVCEHLNNSKGIAVHPQLASHPCTLPFGLWYLIAALLAHWYLVVVMHLLFLLLL